MSASSENMTSLADKPIWRGVKILKWSAIALFVLAVIFFIASIIFGYVDSLILTDEALSEEDSVAINLSYMLDELAWAAVGLGFYAAVLWFLSQILEKVDQLVWLNADEHDRAWLLKTRKKNKNK